jgi:membrane protein YqaA with SNARE-associated domain
MNTVGQWIINFLHLEKAVEGFQAKYNTWGEWIVFIAAFTPIPYKVVTILSGAMQLNLVSFTIFSVLGRGARFYLVAALLYIFGDSLKGFIEKYFDLLTIIFVVLLIGGFLAIKFI